MEKKTPRPNVRVKKSETKLSSKKEDKPLASALSSFQKADDMESGFVKTRKSSTQAHNTTKNSTHDTYENMSTLDTHSKAQENVPISQFHSTKVHSKEYEQENNTSLNTPNDLTIKTHFSTDQDNKHVLNQRDVSKNFSAEDNTLDGIDQSPKGITRTTSRTGKTSEKGKKQTEKVDNSQSEQNNRGYQITISPSLCITAFITLLITLAFIFLFGLIIGKGMVPIVEKEAPEKLQPQMQMSNNDNTPRIVLPKEDLQFMTTLKTEPSTETNTDTRANEQNLADAIGEKQSDIIPSARLYDFNIRAAAFRNSDQADTLRAKLEGAGYRTTLVIEKDSKGKNWYFVHVLLRGSEVRLKEAQNDFKKFAIRDSIIKEQKEVK